MQIKVTLCTGAAALAVALPGVNSLAADPAAPATNDTFAITAGPFQPSWNSLEEKYQCPEWFRDAKFGIWAHWTAQCVPEEGDWYARSMYIQGNKDYKYQVAHYGHPSKFGFKDIDNLWKAEKWDPEKLIELYKRAGAKYFVALANHHDNFDCFDSKYQPWNSVNLGPKQDIVGLWAQAARRNGLRFGVTVHAARAWSWFEVAQGADTNGPLQGVPYDGKLTKADGKGTWWEGYDPQDLYAQNHAPGAKPDRAYIEKFFNRTKDLIDKHHPDLLYFDDGVMPLRNVSNAGLYLAAHYYNSSLQWHNGRNEAVMNTKGLNEAQRKALVWDIERGKSDRIEPLPWQTDTCIGGWHYARSLFENHKYKTAATVVHMLVDIVSKNGNLLLNVPVKGDGTIDSDEVKFLEDMAPWIAINGEGIYGTRPWKTFGEGPSTAVREANRFGGVKDTQSAPFTAEDIRFTQQGNTLYAFVMAWPANGKVVIKSLATGSPLLDKPIASVELLGSPGALKWTRTPAGLVADVPAQPPCAYVCTLRIALR